VAVLAVTAENVGQGTQASVEKTILELIPAFGLEIVPSADVEKASQACETAGCGSRKDALGLGEETGADIVLSTNLSKAGDLVQVRMVAWYIADGTSKEKQAESEKSGILSAARSVMSAVLPPIDHCRNVECSGHGTCFEQDGKPLCECDSGFKAEGLECEKWTMLSSEGTKKKKLLVPDDAARRIRGLAGAGAVFASLSLAAFVAAYVSLCAHVRPNGTERNDSGPAEKAWIASQIAALAAHAIGIPLLLGSRLHLGRFAGDGASAQNISAWVLWAVASATLGVAFWEKLSFAFTTVTIPILVSCVWVSLWESRQAVKIAEGVLAVPYASAISGGMVAGVMGAF